MQENGSDFTLSKPTEGVKLSGAAAGGATVNGSTLWRHPDSKPGAEGATYIQGYMNLSGKRTEVYIYFKVRT